MYRSSADPVHLSELLLDYEKAGGWAERLVVLVQRMGALSRVPVLSARSEIRHLITANVICVSSVIMARV